jgi:hypothetical protein
VSEIITGITMGVLSAAILTASAYVNAKFKSIGNREEAIQKGVKALLRDRIIQMYNHYSGKNCMPIYARENVESLHIEYKALGGNGTVEGLVRRLMLLPTDSASNPDYESRDLVNE